MSSSAGFPVRTSASPAQAQDWTESDRDCGDNSTDWWATFDRATSSWRMSQRSLLEDWDKFSETWPSDGSMRDGAVFHVAPLVGHIHDADCSLWPTPTASMDGRGFGIPLHERSGRYKRSTVLRVQELVKKHGWRIHPRFTETLMGFPTDWSAIEPSGTASTQPSRNGSRGASSKRKG